MLRLRMCDEDREKFGGPQWLQFDADQLLDTPCDQLAAIETETGIVLALAVDNPNLTSARRLWLWLALKHAGVQLAWADFQPKVLRSDFTSGDADPPE